MIRSVKNNKSESNIIKFCIECPKDIGEYNISRVTSQESNHAVYFLKLFNIHQQIQEDRVSS